MDLFILSSSYFEIAEYQAQGVEVHIYKVSEYSIFAIGCHLFATQNTCTYMY